MLGIVRNSNMLQIVGIGLKSKYHIKVAIKYKFLGMCMMYEITYFIIIWWKWVIEYSKKFYFFKIVICTLFVGAVNW